jgi:hypothetical protein
MEIRDLANSIEKMQDHIDGRLDKLEDKLDNHLERISKAETDISWLRGHAKLVLTIFTATLSGLTMAVYELLTKGK